MPWSRWTRRFVLEDWPSGVRWPVLILLSLASVLALEALQLPAALMLGPMVAAILVAAANGAVSVPHPLFFGAQVVLGCMIGGSLPLSLAGEMVRDWPLFLAGVFSVIAAASLLGWLLTRWRVLPGTAGVWGSAPGAASAMTLMAGAYGADMRLVAFMQYLRVGCVTIVASLVSRLWVTGPRGRHPVFVWFPPEPWDQLAALLAFAGLGALAGRLLRIPGSPLLLPLVVSIGLKASGWMTVALPPWLLALSYAAIGWSIGLRFTPAILLHAARVLPRVLASIFALIGICGAVAAMLVALAGIDPLTAYLATSPGGADSIAIIAASSKVDLPFVMAMQTARFLVLIVVGPSIARLIAKWSDTARKAS